MKFSIISLDPDGLKSKIRQMQFEINRGLSPTNPLLRLRRFATIAHDSTILQVPELRKLARKSFRSAYEDCVALNIEKEAQQVISEVIAQIRTNK